MKRVFAIVAVAITCLGLAAARWVQHSAVAKAKREAVYEATLRRFSNDLKPGLSRKSVESYLKTERQQFTQMCCIDQRRDAFADMVKVGEESAPWYCREYYVNIAFEFKATEPYRVLESRDSDILTSVVIFRQPGGCL